MENNKYKIRFLYPLPTKKCVFPTQNHWDFQNQVAWVHPWESHIPKSPSQNKISTPRSHYLAHLSCLNCRTVSYSKNVQSVSLHWIVLQLPKAWQRPRGEIWCWLLMLVVLLVRDWIDIGAERTSSRERGRSNICFFARPQNKICSLGFMFFVKYN